MSKSRYTQLADLLSKAIREGKLAPGSRLPTHRAFAEASGVALATATRVYKELEHRGWSPARRDAGHLCGTPACQ